MPFARLSDRLDAQNAQTGSDRVRSHPDWSDVVFAFHDAEEIGLRMVRTRCEANRLKAGRPVTLKTESGNGSQNRDTGNRFAFRLDVGRRAHAVPAPCGGGLGAFSTNKSALPSSGRGGSPREDFGQ
jgi:hypothetical protein